MNNNIKNLILLFTISIKIINTGDINNKGDINNELNKKNENRELDLSTLKRKNFIDNELNKIEETKKYIIISPKKIPKENNQTPEKENTIDFSIKLFIRNDIKNTNKKSLKYIEKLMRPPKKNEYFLD